MVALGLIVVGFGIESTLDWTWYFPGVGVPVLLCAGWLAGRGPLATPVGWLRARCRCSTVQVRSRSRRP